MKKVFAVLISVISVQFFAQAQWPWPTNSPKSIIGNFGTYAPHHPAGRPSPAGFN